MAGLTIAGSGDHFLRCGEPFFYLADTVWSAFVSAAPDEWEEYLSYRRKQGFNVLQIAVPPQWDASIPHLDIAPFEKGPDGSFDFYAIDEDYFTRAAGMLEKAREHGFIPALVVLWCDYVPDTWLTRLTSERVMPYDAVRPYAEHVAAAFARFDAVFIIGGDTDFESDEAAAYYLAALEAVKSVSPESLTTLHLAAGVYHLPESIERCGLLDFYMYQSGHMVEKQDLAYTLPARFLEQGARKPVVNGEPCYEGIAHSFKKERFGAFDVRKATWHSLLSGAKAGVGYGAHGVWGWHSHGKRFDSAFVSGIPYDWRTALGFRGAWDVAFAAQLFEAADLFCLETRCDLLAGGIGKAPAGQPEASIAASSDLDKVAIYLPFNAELHLSVRLPDLEWTMFDLYMRRSMQPAVRVAGGETIIEAHGCEADVLILGVSR